MACQPRPWVAVTLETKTMKPRLDRDLDVGRAVAVTMDAGIEPAAIGIVVVTDQTVDGDVLAVIEIERQRLRTAQQRFAQREACAARDEYRKRD